MRPVRLELEGFGSYRAPTAVDFTDADLFALTGPTGSGKTTVIDAIVFALYGIVPRYGDRRLVAPVIAQGMNEARVRFDFAVDGITYTAARVVRRTKAGATTKEARLERADGTNLAGTPDELNRSVEGLLGLSYDHFVKCVVLPQGEFAEFLHDKPERRQEMLVELLDLGLYEQMGRLARGRAESAKTQVGLIEARRSDLDAITPEARAFLVGAIETLTGVRSEIDAALPELLALEKTSAEAEIAKDGALKAVALLEAVGIPADVADLASALAAAQHNAALASERVDEAEAATTAAEAARTALPDRSLLERAKAAHDERAKLQAQHDKGTTAVAAAEQADLAARDALSAADLAADAAATALNRAQAAHRAHAVRDDLALGEPCPVCQQVVPEIPDVVAPDDLTAATSARAAAEAALRAARERQQDAQTERVRVESKLADIDQRLDELSGALDGHPDAGEVAALLERVAAADAALETCRAEEKQARSFHATASKALAQAQAGTARARSTFDDARDRVAALGPPARERSDDIAADWDALATWAATEAARQHELATAAVADAEAALQERDARRTQLLERCREAGVEPGHREPRDAVVEAIASTSAALEQLDRDLEEVTRLDSELTALRATRDVADLLGRHLSARGFEKWVLDEAVTLLASGASNVLFGLSRSQYSMTIDPKSGNFAVVDHRNADEVRSARTLSGGETFLASLALALALADQLALLAAHGGARLESIFLDEGFGTLDAETLDTVATAIEELGSQGRVVGLVSHVADLAERVPVRFEITKIGNAATIERIDR